MEWKLQDEASASTGHFVAQHPAALRENFTHSSHRLFSCCTASSLQRVQKVTPSTLVSQKFSQFCERGFSCGNFDLNMVYSNHNRMFCRTTFAVEGHAKANSHRVQLPDNPPLCSCRFLGNHPIGRAYAHCSKVVMMTTAKKSVQSCSMMPSRKALSAGSTVVAGAHAGRIGDAVLQTSSSSSRALAREFTGEVCVQKSVRYNQL